MKSLQVKLFTRYAALIISILILFTVLLYIIWGNTLQSNAASELQADCDNISTLLDSQFESMNQLSKRIVSSKQLKTLFVQDLYSPTVEAYVRKQEFSDELFDIIKLFFDNMELNIYDVNGRYIHIGSTTVFQKRTPESIQGIPWFQPALDAYGKRLIIPSDSPKENGTPAISLIRAFAPESSSEETAVLELQVSYDFIELRIQNAIHNKKEMKTIYIYDKHGTLIYPYNTPPKSDAMPYIMSILNGEEPSSHNALSAMQDSSILFTSRASSYTDWTIFVATEKKEVLSSFYSFRTIIFIVAFFALLLMLFITYQIANKLASPLRALEKTARTLTLDNLNSSELSNPKSTFQELDSLYRSFEQMKISLQNSLQEVVNAHTVAVDAKLLALQSQMNPHFLYNTLASISILAEDGENQKVVDTCNNLSLLLRYISSASSMNVQFWQEIEYTRSYIQLIKIKYEDRIQFHIDIEESLLSLNVPKLIVQPLVENCVKYALNVTAPWIISIHGFTDEQHWFVQVKDNGTGFTQKFLQDFHKKIEDYAAQNFLPDFSINGMGLLNLYTRLFLLYKNNLVFRVENIDNGACVTIGGSLPTALGETTT